ncbi:general transcription factor IIE subunit 1-like [Teleopsis dalmanni]|uniref:general transcription factor IIE subunit 1-like n=1 Tax=Teleopsis dalmanni TaxID=139649 RepID=UPI0018CF5CC9|nr:general transcription factor IIE subunit 1-like [Teleopsis dalmanni]
MTTPEIKYVTEVPNSLKQLARLVARRFYSIDDSLIIDMLVRNVCMKEDDLVELLRFDKKQLRSRILILRNDKFIQMRLKMETGPDGKAQKVNYYFVNYKSFVNVVKYKLDIMRRRMEKEERDATSRANFKCITCYKTFTDLEADKLFDMVSLEFRCTHCGDAVEEDSSAMLKIDSKLMLARFNDQLKPMYELLRTVEGITLAPEILEPEPVDINIIRGVMKFQQMDIRQWSGEATRNQGFSVEEKICINLKEEWVETTSEKKSRPIWMTESTIVQKSTNDDLIIADAVINDSLQPPVLQTTITSSEKSYNGNKKEVEDTMALLLLYEKQRDQKDQFSKDLKFGSPNHNSLDSFDDDRDIENTEIPDIEQNFIDSNSEDDVPSVLAGGKSYPIDKINDEIIAHMTEQEKEHYIHVYQEQFSDIYY